MTCLQPHMTAAGRTARVLEIDPTSTAGILLREHDSPEQAARYAERKATFLGSLGHSEASSYANAAQQLRALLTPPNDAG